MREFPMLYDQAVKAIAHSTSLHGNHTFVGISKAATMSCRSAPLARTFPERTDEVATIGQDFAVGRGFTGEALSA